MAITDFVVSHWKLDEASGNALDAHGSNDLTVNGTGGIGATTGKINGARDFELSESDYFSRADNADLSTGDIDYTIACWVQAESFGASENVIISRYDADGGPREYYLEWNNVGSQRFEFGVYGAANAFRGSVRANVLGTPSTATWYFIVVWHDSVNDIIGISVNGAENTASTTGTLVDTAATTRVGARNSTAAFFWDGLIDELSFWKRVLTSGERTTLYNSGNGLAYPWSTGGPFPHYTRRRMSGGMLTMAGGM